MREISFPKSVHLIINFLNDNQILKNRNELYEFLVFLSIIINYHHRNPSFSSKIKQLIKSIETEIKRIFTNFELFNIFKTSLLILPFLFETQIIIFDEIIFRYFVDEILTNNDIRLFHYFLPEFKSFIPILTKNSQKEKSGNISESENEGKSDKEMIQKMIEIGSIEISPEFNYL